MSNPLLYISLDSFLIYRTYVCHVQIHAAAAAVASCSNKYYYNNGLQDNNVIISPLAHTKLGSLSVSLSEK